MAYNSHFKGEDPSVTKFYGDRTILTSCTYLLPYIKPTMQILDIGCGPGTITAGLSKLVPNGQATGVDLTQPIIERAQSTFPQNEYPNLNFEVGDILELKGIKDGTFDIVHAHQIFVHLKEPLKAMRELRRVCKVGGIVAIREGNGRKIVALNPELEGIREYWANTVKFIDGKGAFIDAGARLEGWAKEVGFGEGDGEGGKIVLQMGKLQFLNHSDGMKGENAEQTIRSGIATREQLERWREAWDEFDRTEGRDFAIETGEILCWKGK